MFVFVALESSVEIIYPRFDQSSSGGSDDLDGLLCVQRWPKFNPGRNYDDISLRTTVYRKPTHIDKLLDESSYNPTSQKATTIRILTWWAELVCNTTDSLSDENKYLDRVFWKNNYIEDFIRRNIHRPITTTEAKDTVTPMTKATQAYLRTSRASYNPSISA